MKHDSIINSKPQLINTIHVPPEIKYLPDTNYEKLLAQYREILSLYLDKNIQKDSLKIDSLGYVYVTDTVTKNLIKSRIYDYNLRHPVITTTIINPPVRKTQLYAGGSLQGSVLYPVNQISGGFLLKNKKDQIFGAYTGINKDGQLQLGISSYWKISFK